MTEAILVWYLSVLSHWGLWGVFALMAMESSVLPVPSECVIPPAVYLQYLHLHLMPVAVLVTVLVGTVGSVIGSLVMYFVARAVGRPLIWRYGKYLGLSKEKILRTEQLVAHHGAGGIIISRLLPVARHVIGIPAGMMGMRLRTYLLTTLVGSALWCMVLAIFGILMTPDIALVLRYGSNVASDQYSQAFQHLSKMSGGILALVIVLYAIFLLSSRVKRLANQGASHGNPIRQSDSPVITPRRVEGRVEY